MVVLLRLSPVIPFALLNYMLSLTAISFFDYTWASAVGIIPGTKDFMYSCSVEALFCSVKARGPKHPKFCSDCSPVHHTCLFLFDSAAWTCVVIEGARMHHLRSSSFHHLVGGIVKGPLTVLYIKVFHLMHVPQERGLCGPVSVMSV